MYSTTISVCTSDPEGVGKSLYIRPVFLPYLPKSSPERSLTVLLAFPTLAVVGTQKLLRPAIRDTRQPKYPQLSLTAPTAMRRREHKYSSREFRVLAAGLSQYRRVSAEIQDTPSQLSDCQNAVLPRPDPGQMA